MSWADDLVRLSDEMKTSDMERAAFVENVKSNVNDMLPRFRKAHAEMAKGFRETLASNEANRKDEAEKARVERGAFVSGLKKTMAELRKRFAEENAAAHRAWSGPAPANF